jgi:hypothetical protein
LKEKVRQWVTPGSRGSQRTARNPSKRSLDHLQLKRVLCGRMRLGVPLRKAREREVIALITTARAHHRAGAHPREGNLNPVNGGWIHPDLLNVALRAVTDEQPPLIVIIMGGIIRRLAMISDEPKQIRQILLSNNTFIDIFWGLKSYMYIFNNGYLCTTTK